MNLDSNTLNRAERAGIISHVQRSVVLEVIAAIGAKGNVKQSHDVHATIQNNRVALKHGLSMREFRDLSRAFRWLLSEMNVGTPEAEAALNLHGLTFIKSTGKRGGTIRLK